MKKLNKQKNQTLVRVSQRRRRIVVERKYDRSTVDPEIYIEGPCVLSFRRNDAETIRFFDTFKSTVLDRSKRRKRNGKWRRQQIYVDFSTIIDISMSAAVILAAELHRWSVLKRTKLSPRNLSSWHPNVRRLLVGLGTFELLNISGKNLTEIAQGEEVTILKLRSGVKNEGKKIADLQKSLNSIGANFEEKKYIFDGLGEAVTNSIEHGYLPEADVRPKHPYAGHRWWATSCFDQKHKCLRFFVYDQGVGIAKTLQSENKWVRIVEGIRKVFLNPTDADYIVGAFEVGKSSTGEPGRGRGLDQILAVIKKAGMGHLRVLSGSGEAVFESDGRVTKRRLSSHVGGTLIEWSIPIAALA